MMPICQVITSNIAQIIGRNSNNINTQTVDHTVAMTEETILLLDQLSQRSTALARSLRMNLREQRHRLLLSSPELLDSGLAWGSLSREDETNEFCRKLR
jgi:hypothetical protein